MKVTGLGALTCWRPLREGLVRTWKKSGWARDTHQLDDYMLWIVAMSRDVNPRAREGRRKEEPKRKRARRNEGKDG